MDPFCIVDEAGKDDDTKDKEEYKQHQLFSRSTKCLKKYFQPRGVASEFEKSENSDDAEELEDISILDVRHVVLEKKVCIETNSGDIVNNIH